MGIFGGKRFFVYGNGISGKAACRAIKKNGGKAKIYSDVDGRFATPSHKAYCGAIVSPGIKPDHAVYSYCKDRHIPVTSEAEIGFALCNCKTVGVTGTNGKTTVTRLIADMLGGTACGNIGYPICSAVTGRNKPPFVCELSSFQLYNADISPDVAVITNMSPDHIDWHGSAENYYASKCRIAANMDHGGVLVLGEDIPIGALDTLRTHAHIVRCSSIGICDGAYVSDGCFWFMGKRVCGVDYLRLPGAHNIKNALCAIAAAMSMGASEADVIDGLSSAKLSAHRIEPVGNYVGKAWIDDSKGTNVSACLAAVDGVCGSVCLILGGRGKDTDFAELFRKLDKRVVEVVAMGETAQEIRDAAVNNRSNLKLTVVNGLADAVAVAAESSAQTVLLSPACASFDEFSSYAERGESFKTAVRALEEK